MTNIRYAPSLGHQNDDRFHGFVVLWFYGFVVCKFLVFWIYGFMVSGFQHFTWFLFSCFQEDIDPISKIFMVYHTDLHHCSAPTFSETVNILEVKDFAILGFHNLEILQMQKNIFLKCHGVCFCLDLGVLVSLKI